MAWGFGNSGAASGGGFNRHDALLRVQAPAHSAVTITKGTYHKSDVGHENAQDHTMYDYYFIIHQSQFDSVNPWTVSATLEGATRSQTVIIDTADEYDVFISFIVYLIKDGLLLDSVQWDLYGDSSTNIAQRSGFVRLGVDTHSWVSGLFVTRTKYPLGGLSTLHLQEYKGDGTHYGQSSASTYTPSIGISSAVPTINNGTAVVTGWDAFQRVAISSNYIANEITTLDISNYNMQAYVSLSIAANQNFGGCYYVRNLWMD